MERGIPRSIKREQAPVDDDVLREAIAEQCIRGEPAAANAVYSEQDWLQQFERRWILQDVRYMRTSTEIAGSGNAIYCRSCVEERKHGRLAAYRLHVTYMDKDPMGVGKHGIIMLECHGCGFEQVVHRKPKLRGSKNGFDANGAWLDEVAGFDPAKMHTALEQQMRAREAANRMNAMAAQSIYDPRYAARGIGGSYANELQGLRLAYENKLISPQQFEEHAKALIEDANRRVNVAANPPLIGKPPKGPFDVNGP